jgi:hypothetical protein
VSNQDLETRVAVLEAKIDAAGLAELPARLATLDSKVDSGFARVAGALWAFAVVGGMATVAAAVLGAFLALR